MNELTFVRWIDPVGIALDYQSRALVERACNVDRVCLRKEQHNRCYNYEKEAKRPFQ